MKSETTKTNVPAGKLDACRTSARRQPSSDDGPAAVASRPAVRLDALEDRQRRAGGEPARPPSSLLDVGELAAGGSRRAADRRDRGRGGRRLVEPGQRWPVELHPRPPVDGERDQRRRVGEELADDELVGAPSGREACRRRPVDPRRPVARPVGPRARDLVSLAAPWAPMLAEANADEPPPRNEGEGALARRAHEPSGAAPASQFGSGRGTRSRQAARMLSRRSLSLASLPISASADRISRWPTTGANSRSMSSAIT